MRCLVSLLLALTLSPLAQADEAGTAKAFQKLRTSPWLLRQFMASFPKGGDLHNHLDGSIYAENIIKWAAEDGKCVAPITGQISFPPCDTSRPAMKDYAADSVNYRQLVDAYSVRNYERGPKSGHDQVFDTFGRFIPGTLGREGDMLREATNRRGAENTVYLELLQSWGMEKARAIAAAEAGAFRAGRTASDWARHPVLQRIVTDTRAELDRIEKRWRELSHCGQPNAEPGCGVALRYLAQVIRTFPPEQVNAQIALAFLLVKADPRYVGLNLVAPEDDPSTLRHYTEQMSVIGALGKLYPDVKVSLHAGEFGFGLVPPEDFRDHIRQALDVAGARRIGHGEAIGLETGALDTLRDMARRGIAVEINLTSNAIVHDLKGDQHPWLLYRQFGVPTALSADDEGVFRIDLTNEYQRAAATYPKLTYRDFKQLSRNALHYGFVEGQALLADTGSGRFVASCMGERPGSEPKAARCRDFLATHAKARLQWDLETRFARFESQSR
ncbi:adenosine deaminase [Pelomonas sp. Root1217]|uniref:adenosine deaminase n=1 Tax=Pelomonas sp. Root1217 TaxID=1736430 RepID=UPI000AA66A77|nr:adenosine deaminase [Pelomonas sp. Root1217]